MERVSVHDALHIGARPVDPAVESVGGVRHSLALDDVEIFVDEQQVVLRDLVEAQAEPLGVVGAGRLRTGGDLPGQPRVVAAVGQRPAGQRQLLAERPAVLLEILREAPFCLLNQVGLGVVERAGHDRSPVDNR